MPLVSASVQYSGPPLSQIVEQLEPRGLHRLFRSIQQDHLKTTRYTFRRLSRGGTYRGVTWPYPSGKYPPPNVETGDMLRAIRPEAIHRRANGWDIVWTCRVPYAAFRNRVAPFLFFTRDEVRAIQRRIALWVAGYAHR